MPACVLRYLASDFRRVYIGLVLFTRYDTERRKSGIERKIRLYVRYQSGAVCRKQPEQIDKRRDGQTVSRSRPATDTRYSTIISTAADRITAGDTALYIPTDTAGAIRHSADKLTAGTIARRDTTPGKYRRNNAPRPNRPRPRPASTEGTARRSLTAPTGFFRARYGAGDDRHTWSSFDRPKNSLSARSAISKLALQGVNPVSFLH